MAVAIEFANVIVRKSAVERSFPGGLDGFARQDLANLSEDDHLLRVGFMSTGEALDFVSALAAMGLRDLGLVADSDIAMIVGSDSAVPPWLSAGFVNELPACWARNYPVGELNSAEPGFLLRCPRRVYDSLADLARQCGAELQQIATEVEPGALEKLRCFRSDAEIIIHVVGERVGNLPMVLWGQRQLARRSQFRSDVALIRDLVEILVLAGAEDK